MIGLYERYLAQSPTWRDDNNERSFYSRLTRNVKKFPLFDLLGTGSADIYDAIFDLEVSNEADLFADSDDEQQHTRNIAPASGDTFRPATVCSRYRAHRCIYLLPGHPI